MPKLLPARGPREAAAVRQVRELAGSRHAPGEWLLHARMLVRRWAGERTRVIATALGCQSQTVPERLVRCNVEGPEGLRNRQGDGWPARLTEAERSVIVAVAQSTLPGKLVQRADGTMRADDPEQDAQWTLNPLTAAAKVCVVQVERSQVRRILRREGVRWQHTPSWASGTDPDFVPKGRGSSRCIPRPGEYDDPLCRRTRFGDPLQLPASTHREARGPAYAA
jgi:transposase